jgi:Pyruvate/2-oxoacid:ferredoxin oxidoreductase delta subunit
MAVKARLAFAGRAVEDPGCAGCAQLLTLRALRRAGLEIRGGPGCDPAAGDPLDPAPGRWAAVVGLEEVARRGEAALVAAVAAAGAKVLVVADRVERPAVAAAPFPGAERPDPREPSRLETVVARASSGSAPGVVVALAPCARTQVRRSPVAVAARRCNRCGACLLLGCPAISDPGGEAMAVDAGTCIGCGLCAPLCRSGAISAARYES